MHIRLRGKGGSDEQARPRFSNIKNSKYINSAYKDLILSNGRKLQLQIFILNFLILEELRENKLPHLGYRYTRRMTFAGLSS